MNDDYDEYDYQAGDSLTDAGVFIAVLLAAAALATLVWMTL